MRARRRTPSRKALLTIAAAFCLATDSGAASQTAENILAGYSPKIVKRLHDKKMTLLPRATDGSLYIGALVLFDQSLDTTQELLSQTERQHEYLPELKTADLIRRDGTAVINEHQVRVMFIRLSYRIRTEFDSDAGRIWWALDPAHENDLDVLEGYWEFYEMEQERTLGRFGTLVDVGPAMPAFLQDLITRKNVPRAIDRARRWVDSDGRYRP